MLTKYYNIVDIPMQITTPSEDALRMFELFETAPAEPELQLSIVPMQPDCQCNGVSYFALSQDYTHVLMNSSNLQDGCLLASPDWSLQKLLTNATQNYVYMDSLAAAFYSRLTRRGGLLLHASAILYNGGSVLFTAPSGTGKTTQAELWHEHLGADILNGDKVFLREKNGQIHAWGSPWKGSSPYTMNTSAPVKAIVVLSQAPCNHIRKLDGLEILSHFTPHVFYPRWDEACMNPMMETLDHVISEIPIYALECRPDREAVMLLKETLWP